MHDWTIRVRPALCDCHHSSLGSVFGVCFESHLSRMPVILFAPECRDFDWSVEAFFFSVLPVECDSDFMSNFLVTIHEHDGPPSIRTLHGVSRHQLVASPIFNVALRR